MEESIFNLEGVKKGKMKLPIHFSMGIRPDIIHRAVISMQANRRQPYGPSPRAGMRHAVSNPGKGRGIARVQRLTQYGNTAAESPNNVGGRRAHPPTPEKLLGKKMNKKERKKARASALAATANESLVRGRGHLFDEGISLPLIVDKNIENIEKTAEAVDVFRKLGIYPDIERVINGEKVRAGKGKMRNRRKRTPVGPLVVLPAGSKGASAFSNIPGVDVRTPTSVTVEDLAPGGDIGRLVVFSVKALNETKEWS